MAATRVARMGTASLLNIFMLTPGLHQQQAIGDITYSEFPVTGDLTTGYVFHVENPATVGYLEGIGCSGHLITTKVSPHPFHNTQLSYLNRHLQSLFVLGVPAALLYLLCLTLTIAAAVFLGIIWD
ncbi:hypothetical protein EDD18DRAFT_1358052 [Armillaria luteobubalina]|uniref:Uncharacterized protein n=1 Tax=Armillaria luteobubalina TaxID=153913 RepID=A0AA39UJV0_9AGAR|nr:hypothetical protein EDD18DRAFT_1358052 [Armillaria luteobubalina]